MVEEITKKIKKKLDNLQKVKPDQKINWSKIKSELDTINNELHSKITKGFKISPDDMDKIYQLSTIINDAKQYSDPSQLEKINTILFRLEIIIMFLKHNASGGNNVELTTLIQKLETQKQEIQAKLDTCTQTLTENDGEKLKARIKELEDANAALETSTPSSSGDEEKAALEAKVTSLETAKTELEVKVKELEDAKAVLESSTPSSSGDDEKTALEAKVAALEARVAKLEPEKAALEAEKAALESKVAALQTSTTSTSADSEKEALKAKVAALEPENATVKAENATVKAENATVKAENATVKAENATVKAEIKRLEDEKAASSPPSNDLIKSSIMTIINLVLDNLHKPPSAKIEICDMRYLNMLKKNIYDSIQSISDFSKINNSLIDNEQFKQMITNVRSSIISTIITKLLDIINTQIIDSIATKYKKDVSTEITKTIDLWKTDINKPKHMSDIIDVIDRVVTEYFMEKLLESKSTSGGKRFVKKILGGLSLDEIKQRILINKNDIDAMKQFSLLLSNKSEPVVEHVVEPVNDRLELFEELLKKLTDDRIIENGTSRIDKLLEKEKENEKLQENIVELKADNEELRKTILENDRINDEESLTSGLDDPLSKCKTDLKECKEELYTTDGDIIRAKKENRQLKTENLESKQLLHEQSIATQEQITALHEHHQQELKAWTAHYETIIATKQETINKLMETQQSIKDTVSPELIREMDTKYEAIIEQLSSEIEQLSSENERQQTIIEELRRTTQSSFASIKSNLQQNEKFFRECAENFQKAQQCNHDLAELSKEYEHIRQHFEEYATKSIATNAELQSSIYNLENLLEECNKRIVRNDKMIDEYDEENTALMDDYTSIVGQLKTLERMSTRQRQELEELTRIHNEALTYIKDTKPIIEGSEANVKNLQESTFKLTELLEEKEVIRKTLEKCIAETKSMADRYSETVGTLTLENERLKSENETLRDDLVAQADSYLKQIDNHHSESETQISDMRQHHETLKSHLEGQLTQLRQEKQVCDQTNEQLSGKIDLIDGKYSRELQDIKERYKAQIEHLTSKISQIEGDNIKILEQKEEDIKNLTDQLIAAEKEKNDRNRVALKSEEDSLEMSSIIEQLRKKVEDFESANRALHIELLNEKRQNDGIILDLNGKLGEMPQILDKINLLEEQIREKDNEQFELNRKIKSLEYSLKSCEFREKQANTQLNLNTTNLQLCDDITKQNLRLKHENDEHKHSHSVLTAQLGVLESKNQELEIKLKEMPQLLEKIKSLQQEIEEKDKLKLRCDTEKIKLTRDKESLISKLSVCELTETDLNQRLELLKTIIEEYKSIENSNLSLSTENEQHKTRHSVLTAQLGELELKNKELKSELASTRQQLEIKDRNNNTKEHQCKLELDSLREINEQLKSAHEQIRQQQIVAHDAFDSKLDECVKKIKDSQELLLSTQVRNAATLLECESKNNEIIKSLEECKELIESTDTQLKEQLRQCTQQLHDKLEIMSSLYNKLNMFNTLIELIENDTDLETLKQTVNDIKSHDNYHKVLKTYTDMDKLDIAENDEEYVEDNPIEEGTHANTDVFGIPSQQDKTIDKAYEPYSFAQFKNPQIADRLRKIQSNVDFVALNRYIENWRINCDILVKSKDGQEKPLNKYLTEISSMNEYDSNLHIKYIFEKMFPSLNPNVRKCIKKYFVYKIYKFENPIRINNITYIITKLLLGIKKNIQKDNIDPRDPYKKYIEELYKIFYQYPSVGYLNTNTPENPEESIYFTTLQENARRQYSFSGGFKKTKRNKKNKNKKTKKYKQIIYEEEYSV